MESTYDLYFTGKDDARDGLIVIGEDTKPIFFMFETPNFYMVETRTTVYRNSGEVVALLDWTTDVHLGRATIGLRHLPMSELVQMGSTPNARSFSSEGNIYEWRRCYDDPQSYDLFAVPGRRIATFRRYLQATPVGLSHSYLRYTFSHDVLLLESLIALCLNRWLDFRGI